MNKTLTTIFALAVACVTAVSHAQEAKGDVEAGEAENCHVHRLPRHSGLPVELSRSAQGAHDLGPERQVHCSALTAYKKGERKHPTMRGVSDSLTEQDIADVSAYYEQHGKTRAPSCPPSRAANPACKWPSC
jgi:cytochrome c553